MLKAADEVVGKLRSLANEDFKSLRRLSSSSIGTENHDLIGLLYFLSNLWAHIEIFRARGLSITLSKDKRGEYFQCFTDCLESRRVRLVDRITQRAIGEKMQVRYNGKRETITFVELFEGDDEARRWLNPVARILERTLHTSERQHLLQYGTIVHAMIDTLDPNHQVTRERPSYPHKLSKKTRISLKYRVFGIYLKFVKHQQKYLGPPKRRPR